MNHRLIAITCMIFCGNALAMSANTTNTTNTTNPFYIGTNFSDGSFNNQYRLNNNNKLHLGDTNNGFTANDIHLGYRYQNYRFELALDYLRTFRDYQQYDSNAKENLLHSTASSSIAGFVSAYYDYNFSSQFAAFAGIGVGYIHTLASGTAATQKTGETASANNLAYEGKVGATMQITSYLDAYADYQMIRLTGNNPYMNNNDYYSAFGIGVNYLF